MNNLRYLLAAFSTLVLFSGRAQNSSEVYHFNPYYYNAAFAGAEGSKMFSFVDLRENTSSLLPEKIWPSVMLGYEHDLKKINSGIAVTAYAGFLGPSSTNSVKLSYNYRFAVGDFQIIPALNSRRTMLNVDASYYRAIQPDDPALADRKPFQIASWEGDAALLVKYKKAFVGGQVNNVISSVTSTWRAYDYKPAKFQRLIGGADMALNEKFKIRIIALMTFEQVNEASYDVNALATFKKFLHIGIATSRSSDDKFYPRAVAGVTIDDYLTFGLLLYSKTREFYGDDPKRGQAYIEFKF
jgi:type IX secretion system PorP/SprF family membrane protein